MESSSAKMARAIDVMERDFAGVRTGRASTSLVERIQVEYYGTQTPLNQLASVNVEDARTLIISPWEKKLLPQIEKALLKSDVEYL